MNAWKYFLLLSVAINVVLSLKCFALDKADKGFPVLFCFCLVWFGCVISAIYLTWGE